MLYIVVLTTIIIASILCLTINIHFVKHTFRLMACITNSIVMAIIVQWCIITKTIDEYFGGM